MKQRLAIASAILNDPEVLILDEPTNGLDPQGIHEIREIIKNIAANGTTILLASHLLDEVEKVCSHAIVIREGKKLYSGKVNEMSASHGVFVLQVESEQEKVLLIVEKHPAVNKVSKDHKTIIATLNKEMSASKMNKYLFDNGFIVSHLVKRKPSLEEQFLDLTNNN
jgi:ABC-2 type transport system ATP-binding protein